MLTRPSIVSALASAILLFSQLLIAASDVGPAGQSGGPDLSKLFPEGPGRDDVLVYCVTCHDLSVPVVQRKDEGAWRYTIEKMLNSMASKAQVVEMAAYMGKNFGPNNPLSKIPVDVNTATAAELKRLPGISDTDGTAIIERRKGGKFATLDEVKAVLGNQKWNEVSPFLVLR